MKYQSTTSADELVGTVLDSIAVGEVPSRSYVYLLLNSFMEFVYSTFISDVRCVTVKKENGVFSLPREKDDCREVSRECVKKVYANGKEYERVGAEYPERLCVAPFNLYRFNDSADIVLLGDGGKVDSIELSFRAKPTPYVEGDGRVLYLPNEYVGLCEAKLKSEIYRITEATELCAEWTAQYNNLLSNFRIWLEVNG